RRLGVEEQHDERRALTAGSVRLEPGQTELSVDRPHYGQEAAFEAGPLPRHVLDLAGRQAPEAALDRLQRVCGREQARDLVLGQPLLDRVADDDQEDEIEGLERRELAAPGDARQEEDEGEEDEGSNRNVHQGNTHRCRLKKRSRVLPSSSSTVWRRPRATLVGLTWNCRKRM